MFDYDEIEASAFDNFDPDNFDADIMDTYDPENFKGQPKQKKVNTARAGQKLQVNLTLNNPTTEKITVELFSALDSVVNRRKAELAKGAYTMIPQLSMEGLAANGAGVVGFDQNGDLVLKGAAADAKLSVSCNEYPYKSLFDSSAHNPFQVAYMRLTCQTDLQIDNNITHFQKTFGGGVKENTISPRAYFKPNQYQSRTIDILAPFTISGERGLLIPINAGETVRIALFIQRWAKDGL